MSILPIDAIRRYPRGMRRPEVELSDEAARFVEQHPDAVERLAGGAQLDAKAEQYGITADQRSRFRGYIREKLAAGRSPEAIAAGDAWLAQYGLNRAQLR